MQDTNKEELVIHTEIPVKYKTGYRLISCISPIIHADTEDYANAKLIAHSKEILELLIECFETFTCNDSSERDLKSRVEKLIKSATEVGNGN